MSRPLLASLLLLFGGLLLVLLSNGGRPNLRARLRTAEGLHHENRVERRRAGLGVLGVVVLAALPVVVDLLGAGPVLTVVAVVVVAPVLVVFVAELVVALQGRGIPVRVPVLVPWQRRTAKQLAAWVAGPLTTSSLRVRRAARSPRRVVPVPGRRQLLVVRPGRGRESVRVWQIAESYLGGRHRVADVLRLNHGRTGPDGLPFHENTRLARGWMLVLPPDADGPGIVDLPEELATATAAGRERSVPPPPQDRRPGATAAAMKQGPGPSDHPDPSHGAERPPDDGSAEPAGAQPPAPVRPGRAVAASAPATVADPPPAADRPPTAGAAPLGRHRLPAQDERVPLPASGPAAVQARRGIADGHPPAVLPWDLVHAGLLADGVRSALDALRMQRDHDRPWGAAVRPLDEAAAAVHLAAELGADVSGADFLDRALRALGTGLARRGAPVPTVVGAHLRGSALELVLREPDTDAPPPFSAVAGGRVWRVSRDVDLPGAQALAPLPALVGLGAGRDGRVLLDLEAPFGPVHVVGDPRAVRLVVLALALEVATKRWGDRITVTMVGFEPDLAAVDPRIRTAPRLDHVLDDVLRVAAANRSVLAEGGFGSALEWRVRGGAGPAVHAQVLVLASPPSPEEAARLRLVAGAEGRVGLAVLVAGGGEDAGLRLELGADGMISTFEPGLRAGAQAVSEATAAALARLAVAEGGSLPRGAGNGGDVVPVPVAARAPLPSAADITVRLFGRPQLQAPTGPLPADERVVEAAAFLALSGRTTHDDLAAAMWPRGVSDLHLSATLQAVARVLGHGADDEPRLRDDGRTIEVTADVQPDWHLFLARAADGYDEAALALLGDDGWAHGARPYPWSAVLALSRSLPGYVADVAHRRFRTCMDGGRPDLAAAAVGAALRLQPHSQALRGDLETALERAGSTGTGGARGLVSRY